MFLTRKIIIISFLVMIQNAMAKVPDALVAGELKEVAGPGNSVLLTYQCTPPDGDHYFVTLDRDRVRLTVEKPEEFKVEGFPIVTTEFTAGLQHFSFSNGFNNVFHYDFQLTIEKANTANARFNLIGNGRALRCQTVGFK